MFIHPSIRLSVLRDTWLCTVWKRGLLMVGIGLTFALTVGILGSWSLARTGVDDDCPLVEKVLNVFTFLRP